MNDGLSIGSANTISVVEKELVDDVLVLDSQLRAHDVLLHLSAKFFQSPAIVELDFKFDLLCARILGVRV